MRHHAHSWDVKVLPGQLRGPGWWGNLTDGSSTTATPRLRLASRFAQLTLGSETVGYATMMPCSRLGKAGTPQCPAELPNTSPAGSRGSRHISDEQIYGAISRKGGRPIACRKSNGFRFNMAPETCTSNGNNQGPGQALREEPALPCALLCASAA